MHSFEKSEDTRDIEKLPLDSREIDVESLNRETGKGQTPVVTDPGRVVPFPDSGVAKSVISRYKKPVGERVPVPRAMEERETGVPCPAGKRKNEPRPADGVRDDAMDVARRMDRVPVEGAGVFDSDSSPFDTGKAVAK